MTKLYLVKMAIGNNKGRFWKDLNIETLDKALQYYKERNEYNYSNVIEKILLEKIEREKTNLQTLIYFLNILLITLLECLYLIFITII